MKLFQSILHLHLKYILCICVAILSKTTIIDNLSISSSKKLQHDLIVFDKISQSYIVVVTVTLCKLL